MEKEGFKYTVYNGENVWQLGHAGLPVRNLSNNLCQWSIDP